jgi:spore coat polysaccharide biosynthesis protein SpsF (cytidylyltransferase family)
MNIAIIQARSESTRLPGKVLMQIEDKTVLEHVIDRVNKSYCAHRICVICPDNDYSLIDFCKNKKIRYFDGDEFNVLNRFYEYIKYQCTVEYPKNIIRITCDCPLICSEIIDHVMSIHISENNDYTSNRLPGYSTYPDGTDVEIFKTDVLLKTWQCAKLESEKLHVTPFMINHPELFKKSILTRNVDHGNKRWTLDQIEDLYFIKEVYKRLYKKDQYFGYEDIIELLCKYPEIENINSGIQRDEGYFKDLENENNI